MIEWLLNLFRPKLVYMVFNEEEHVGSFFQEIFYDRTLAEAYIIRAHKQEVESQKDLNAIIADLVEKGEYPAELFDPSEPVSRLKLTIQEWIVPRTRKDATAVW